MIEPKRIQRKRTKGWTKPEGAIYVGRGSEWGNPYPLADTQIRMPALDDSEWEHEGRLGKTSGQRHAFVHPGGAITWHRVENATPEQIVELYRRWLAERPVIERGARRRLAGHDLMCWCPLVDDNGNPVPCHADVLLEIANGGEAQ